MHLLAQVNVARLRSPLDAPEMRDFVAAVDPVNRLAEASPGFVWRLKSTAGHGVTSRSDGGSAMFVNLSVWRSYEALHAFVYRSVHGVFVRRRVQWFLPTPQPATALWWVAVGDYPTVDDAMRRLVMLQRYGPTPRAFSLRQRFGPDGQPAHGRGAAPRRAARGVAR